MTVQINVYTTATPTLTWAEQYEIVVSKNASFTILAWSNESVPGAASSVTVDTRLTDGTITGDAFMGHRGMRSKRDAF